MNERTLTDADIEAIAKAIKDKFKKEFYSDLGRGVWAIAWKSIVVMLIGIAAYGATKGGH
jgi:hypothetical protein